MNTALRYLIISAMSLSSGVYLNASILFKELKRKLKSEIYQLQIECDRLADEVDQWSDTRGMFPIFAIVVSRVKRKIPGNFLTNGCSAVGRDQRGVLPRHLYRPAVANESPGELESAALAEPTAGVATGAPLDDDPAPRRQGGMGRAVVDLHHVHLPQPSADEQVRGVRHAEAVG